MPQSQQKPRQDQAPAQQRQGTLNFITFGEPQQLISTRAIRSHAAKAGWQSRKNSRSLAATARQSLLRPTTEHAPLAQVVPPRYRGLPVVPSWPNDDIVHRPVPSLTSSSRHSSQETNSSNSTPSTPYSPPEDMMDTLVSEPEPEKSRHVYEDEKVVLPQSVGLVPTDMIVSQPKATWSLQAHQLGSIHDPFSQFPVRWEDSFGPLVQFYRNCIGEAWMKQIAVDWGHQSNTEFVDFPFQLSVAQREPAIFYAVLSNTSVMAPASNAISMRQQPFLSQWLRYKAVEALSKAVMDPARAYTDAVICTVVYVYFNEVLRDERETAIRVHAPALKRMVAARGGLGVIASNGKSGLILSRYLTWCDRIVASTLGAPLLFADHVEDPIVGKTKWDGMWSKVQTMM